MVSVDAGRPCAASFTPVCHTFGTCVCKLRCPSLSTQRSAHTFSYCPAGVAGPPSSYAILTLAPHSHSFHPHSLIPVLAGVAGSLLPRALPFSHLPLTLTLNPSKLVHTFPCRCGWTPCCHGLQSWPPLPTAPSGWRPRSSFMRSRSGWWHRRVWGQENGRLLTRVVCSVTWATSQGCQWWTFSAKAGVEGGTGSGR